MNEDIKKHLILRCLEISKGALGKVFSNPMVGCIIVHNDSHKIIGEGFHKEYGKEHAEVNAIANVKDSEALRNATLIVNLEPCNHYGKTPPCTSLIIEKKIPNIIIGTLDPNPLVAGSGVKKLVEAGCHVETNFCTDDCRFHNRRFFTFHEQKRPYIILKWAQTLDGYIDIDRKTNNSKEKIWISNPESNILVHKWRAEEMGIMVGTNTALNDNPSLNVRYWHGNNPTRIVIDEYLKLNISSNLLDNSQETLVFNGIKNQIEGNVEFIELNFASHLIPQILSALFERKIVSVLVEGGKILHEHFIAAGLWDEARIIVSIKQFFKGLKAPIIPEDISQIENITSDQLRIIYNKQSGFFPS